MNMKLLSFIQVRWDQKLLKYYFWVNYYRNKANKVVDALSQYLLQNIEEKATLQIKNTKFLNHLQSLLATISSLLINNYSPLYQIMIHKTLIIHHLY